MHSHAREPATPMLTEREHAIKYTCAGCRQQQCAGRSVASWDGCAYAARQGGADDCTSHMASQPGLLRRAAAVGRRRLPPARSVEPRRLAGKGRRPAGDARCHAQVHNQHVGIHAPAKVYHHSSGCRPPSRGEAESEQLLIKGWPRAAAGVLLPACRAGALPATQRLCCAVPCWPSFAPPHILS